MSKKEIAKKTTTKTRSSKKSRLFILKYHIAAFSFAFVICGFLIGLSSFFVNLGSTHVCANSISCIQDLSGLYQPETQGEFMGHKVVVPAPIADADTGKKVLGDSTGAEKHVFVDLTTQHLYAFEGSTLKWSFLISSGKWHPTPTGDFHIWVKLRYTRMVGGDPKLGTYYNLPNVPYTMYFYNDEYGKSEGYSLHGTYWHNNFGHPMSHGCVNMKTEDAAMLYDWVNPPTQGYTTYATDSNPGTLITIYGKAPNE